MIRSFFRRALTALAVVAGLTAPAAAQNFDGSGIIRFGVFGAGEFYDAKSVPADIASASFNGGAIGFSAGYDLTFARHMVLGIEADLQVGDTRGSIGSIPIHADYLATLRGRVGARLTPDIMVYGTGGVAWAGLGLENTSSSGTGGLNDSNKTLAGWVAGGGVELELRDYFGTILFGEYLVGGFDSWSRPDANTFGIDTDVQTFRLGVKFKVGHDYHAERSAGPLK